VEGNGGLRRENGDRVRKPGIDGWDGGKRYQDETSRKV
jgi:hypothetical protein